jgi:hypothetical protein
MACKYKDIFGKVNSGIHKYRLFNIAIVDVIGTIIIGLLLAYFLKLNYAITILVLFLLGIILHRFFCVNTTINKIIFGII